MSVRQGKHRHGQLITKTKLEPDPETAPIIKGYFARRVKGESIKEIFEDFYMRGIPSPKGRSSWSVSTGASWERNLDVYPWKFGFQPP